MANPSVASNLKYLASNLIITEKAQKYDIVDAFRYLRMNKKFVRYIFLDVI